MYPFTAPAISVIQPYSRFVITSLPAHILLDTAYSDRLTAIQNPDGTYHLSGSQRKLAEPRLRDIGKYIGSEAASFPNAIIIAANYREEDGFEEEDELSTWKFQQTESAEAGQLVIPKSLKRAAIIDGQHRLFGFNYAANPDRLQMPLVCSVFFELPKSYQARLFATINANQRPVNKSQTYELFGYNLEDESPDKWTPEKLSVYMSRKLNAELDSPFHQHIIVPAENDFSVSLAKARRSGDWAVSMATIVEGTMRLISNNPKNDAYAMDGAARYVGGSRSRIEPSGNLEQTPLRELFRECNDEIIYAAISNYFTAVSQTLWHNVPSNSFIRKTVGIQALFDIARPLLYHAVIEKDLRVESFVEHLKPADAIDFSDSFFNASGAGRTKIRKALQFAIAETGIPKSESEYDEYHRIVKS